MAQCQICGNSTKKETAKFCSIQCKSISQKIKKEPLDASINVRCRLDGKIFSDYENRGGVLSRYSRDILEKSFDWNDWERIQVKQKETWNCSYCEWRTKDVENKSGWITTHLEKQHNLSPEDHCLVHPEDKKLWKQRWIVIEREAFLMESDENRIQCLECCAWFKKISNTHLREKHNMTELEYMQKYGPNSLSSMTFREKMSQYFQINGNPNTTFKSKYEDQICEFLDELNISYTRHYLKLGFEIDIFIEEWQLGIEFNGLFFHSEYGGGKLKYYHRNKTEQCEKMEFI
jgi:hypothetical protein